jgi:predicted phage-related endonuclease
MSEEPREQWLLERSTGLGGTDVAQIAVAEASEEERLGAYKGSLLEIWAVKSANGKPPPISPLDIQKEGKDLQRGHDMEGYIAQRYRTEFEIREQPMTPGLMRHPGHPIVLGTADRLFVMAPPRGLEAKSRRYRRGWGPSGTDEVPLDGEIQCRVYMEVYDINRWDVAVAFGLDDFRFYALKRDMEFGQRIIAMAEAWWEHFVVGCIPPEPGWGEECRKVLERLHRDPRPTLRPPANEERVLHKKVVAARKVHEKAKRQKDLLQNQLRATIGSDSGIDGVANWTQVNPKPKFNMDKFKEEQPALYRQYCEPAKGYRRLNVITGDS